MPRYCFSLPIWSAGLLCWLSAPLLHAQPTKSPQIVEVFREVVARPSLSTVRVLAQKKEVALGVIVSADGWILTKHSELKPGSIVCRLPDGKEVEARLVGFDVPFDLAMLKVEAKDLQPVEWVDSKIARAGHWVASPGRGTEPVAIGVIGAEARVIKGAKYVAPSGSQGGYLGLALDLGFAGVKIQEIIAKTPAEKAGLKAMDQVLSINGKAVENADEFLALLSTIKPGDEVNLKVARDEMELDLKAKLEQRPGAKGGKTKADIQNSMGSKLSDRRAGFPIVLQHDSILKPADCGGPLVNLDGKVIGINISRAGRTETFAIPSEAVRPLLEKLKIGKVDKK